MGLQVLRGLHDGVQRIIRGHNQGWYLLSGPLSSLNDGSHELLVVRVEVYALAGEPSGGGHFGRHNDDGGSFWIRLCQRPFEHEQVLWRPNGNEFAVSSTQAERSHRD